MEAHLLLIYDNLSPSERREADAYLEAHPEAWEMVEQGRVMEALFREAALAPPDSDEDELQNIDRVREVVESLPPAREHLAALMREAPRPAVRRPSADRPSRPRERRRLRGTWVAVMMVLVVALGLVIASVTSHQPYERIASLSSVPHTIPGLTLRSDDVSTDQVSEAYLTALELTHDARSSTLGLFPDYDEAQLNLAINHLTEAVNMDPNGAIGLEALYVRGRLHLHLGDVEQAEQDLNLVIDRSGPSASDARRIIDQIEDRLKAG